VALKKTSWSMNIRAMRSNSGVSDVNSTNDAYAERVGTKASPPRKGLSVPKASECISTLTYGRCALPSTLRRTRRCLRSRRVSRSFAFLLIADPCPAGYFAPALPALRRTCSPS
jgi:hypothetical protein